MSRMFVLAAVLLSARQEKENPDLKFKKEWGVAMNKPAKNEEWAFKENGFFTGSLIVVGHKVDELNIEITGQEKATGSTAYDPKAAAEGEFKNISGFKGISDAKKTVEIKPSKLPGNGANGVMANFLDMTFKKEGKAQELRMWVFLGKANQNLYKVCLSCEEGMYKKYQKHVDYILSSIQILKVAK